MDVVLAFPALLLAISIVTISGTGIDQRPAWHHDHVHPAIRAALSRQRTVDQRTGIRNRGAGSWRQSTLRIVLAHILPNAITPIIVQGTLGVGTAILDAAALSFLGFGRSTADAGMGADPQRIAQLPFHVAASRLLPRLCDHDHGAGFQPLLGDGMRGRVGSAAESELGRCPHPKPLPETPVSTRRNMREGLRCH